MVTPFRFLLIVVGLLTLPLTPANAQPIQGPFVSPIILGNQPSCDPVLLRAYEWGKPTGFAYLEYKGYPPDRKCARFACRQRGLCVSEFRVDWGGPVRTPLQANARGCIQSVCVTRFR